MAIFYPDLIFLVFTIMKMHLVFPFFYVNAELQVGLRAARLTCGANDKNPLKVPAAAVKS